MKLKHEQILSKLEILRFENKTELLNKRSESVYWTNISEPITNRKIDKSSVYTFIYNFYYDYYFDHILNMQKYVMHNFVSSYHGQKMGVGFNLALFIFRPQLLRHFSDKEKYKTGILAIEHSLTESTQCYYYTDTNILSNYIVSLGYTYKI